MTSTANNLRFACASTINLSPKTVDFQSLQAYFASRDQILKGTSVQRHRQ